MRESFLQKVILPTVIMVGAFVASFGLSDYLERSRPPLPEDLADADLNMNGSRLKGFAFGTEGLIADWYWMRSLQYVGDKVLGARSEKINIDDLRDLNPRLLYPLLENATDLDPHFIAPYSYGAVVLPAIDPEKAILITQKGIENNPNEWRLHQYLGFIYWKLKRFDEAAETYEKGSMVPGAAPFMKLMAAAMKKDGGSRSTARAMYREMLAGSDDEQIRNSASVRLEELDSLDERDAIDKALSDYRERSGRCANSLSDILPMLMQLKLPEGHDFRVDKSNRLVDPTEAPYLLDKDECRVKVDTANSKLPKK
ncbi:MAG: tetratricopeptide repeat protein [Acidobacteriota bacterium]